MLCLVAAGVCVFLVSWVSALLFFFFQAEDGIRDLTVTGVQTCALPISPIPPMLKWILGCLGLAIVIVACAVWFGYRKLQTFADSPPVATVTINAPPKDRKSVV